MDGYGGYDYGYDENVRPAENNAFVMRMAQDIAKRENEKRVNEMRKTVEVAFLPCCRVCARMLVFTGEGYRNF